MKQKNRLNYVVFIAPTMVLFLLVFAVPVVVLVGSSFCNWRTGDPITFNGIGNYIELIFHDNSFRQGFLNNVSGSSFREPSTWLSACCSP